MTCSPSLSPLRALSATARLRQALQQKGRGTLAAPRPQCSRLCVLVCFGGVPYLGASTINICRPSSRGKASDLGDFRDIVLHLLEQVHTEVLVSHFNDRGNAGVNLHLVAISR